MSLWKIAWRSIQQRALASSLTGLSMALGVMLVVAVLVAHGIINQSFMNTGLGYNLVVGAKGGRLELVLNSVYYLTRSNETIPYSYYQEFVDGQYKDYVDKAIPVCLGDMLGEFRVIGTTSAFFNELDYGGKKYEFAEGRNFEPDEYFCGVIGATVAREMGLKAGDEFQPAHGVGPEAHVHDPFKILGVLKPTGTPNDRGVFINMEGFYLIPEHAKPDDEPVAAHAEGEHQHEHAEGAEHKHEHGEHADEAEHKHEHATGEAEEHKHEHAAGEGTEHKHEHAEGGEAEHKHEAAAGEGAEPKHDHEHADADHKHEGHDHEHGEQKAGEHAHDEHEGHDHAEHKHGDEAHAGHDHAGHHHHDHGDHGHSHEPLPISKREVTAVLVLTKSIGGAPPELTAMDLMKKINKGNVAQVVLPIREMTGLFNTFVDPLRIVLLSLTILIVIVSGIGILVSIYNSMNERQHEIAVIRALGAGRQKVMLLVLLESILLSLAGGLAGWVLGHALIAALSPWIAVQTGVSIGFWQFVSYELVIIPALIALAALVGYLPAMTAYRTDVAKALSATP